MFSLKENWQHVFTGGSCVKVELVKIINILENEFSCLYSFLCMIVAVSNFIGFLLLAHLTFQVAKCLKMVRGNDTGKELCFQLLRNLFNKKPF